MPMFDANKHSEITQPFKFTTTEHKVYQLPVLTIELMEHSDAEGKKHKEESVKKAVQAQLAAFCEGDIDLSEFDGLSIVEMRAILGSVINHFTDPLGRA